MAQLGLPASGRPVNSVIRREGKAKLHALPDGETQLDWELSLLALDGLPADRQAQTLLKFLDMREREREDILDQEKP